MRSVSKLFWFSFFVRVGLGAVFFRDDLKLATFLAAGSSVIFSSIALLYLFFEPSLPRIKSRAALPLFLYLTWQLISIAWTKASVLSAAGYWTLNLSDLVFVWCAAKAVPEQDGVRDALSGLVYSSLAMAGIGLSSHVGSLSSRDDLVLQPNFLGNMYAVGLMVACYLWKSLKNPKWLVLALLLSIALALTLSKTSIIAVAVSLIIMFWDSLSRMKHKAAYSVAIVLVVAVTAAAVHVDIAPEPSDFLTGRPALWFSLLPIIARHPIIGSGFASFKEIAPDVWEGLLPPHAHNEALQQLATLGVIGLFLSVLVYRASFSSRWTIALPLNIYFLIRGLTEAEPYQTIFPLALILLLTTSPLGDMSLSPQN